MKCGLLHRIYEMQWVVTSLIFQIWIPFFSGLKPCIPYFLLFGSLFLIEGIPYEINRVKLQKTSNYFRKTVFNVFCLKIKKNVKLLKNGAKILSKLSMTQDPCNWFVGSSYLIFLCVRQFILWWMFTVYVLHWTYVFSYHGNCLFRIKNIPYLWIPLK